MSDPIHFKFHFVDANGNQQGFLAKKGSFDGAVLKLDETGVPVGAIVKALRRYDRIAISVALPGAGAGRDEAGTIVVAVAGKPGKTLHMTLNRASSQRRADARQEELVAAGKGDRFRAEVCPQCEATIDLSGFEVTPQVYCDYCNRLTTIEGAGTKDEATYQLCDQCGLYSQPKVFTLFYFYFLLVVYGWRYQKVHYCNACMRSQAWKMFFGNLLFVLGVPVAIVQLCRAYFGGSARSEAFKGLDRANALATAGKVDKAAAIYDAIAGRLGSAAGIHYSHGLALARAGRESDAVIPLEMALADCGNYHPATEALYHCYTRTGQPQRAELIKALWAGDDDAIDAALAKIEGV